MTDLPNQALVYTATLNTAIQKSNATPIRTKTYLRIESMKKKTFSLSFFQTRILKCYSFPLYGTMCDEESIFLKKRAGRSRVHGFWRGYRKVEYMKVLVGVEVGYIDFQEAIQNCTIWELLRVQMISGSVTYLVGTAKKIKCG